MIGGSYYSRTIIAKYMKCNHGANLTQLSTNTGIIENKLIDFSSNITPFGLSLKGIEVLKEKIKDISIYPDPNYTKLKMSIAKYCNCTEENIVLGNGATELISATIKCVSPKSALLISPIYSEYERELNNIGVAIDKFYYKEDNNFVLDINKLTDIINKNNYDIIVICNPNNPTGQLLNIEKIDNILKVYTGVLMIDETYIEFTDKKSSVTLVEKYNNLVVIRGTSKFFATPGLRLGYAIVSEGVLSKKIKELPNLWNINICASIMGEVMFLDDEFITATKAKFKENFKFLYEGLKKIDSIKVFESESNFILCKILDKDKDCEKLYEYLLKFGIIIRKANSFENLDNKFFRVCVLEKGNIELLLDKLNSYFS